MNIKTYNKTYKAVLLSSLIGLASLSSAADAASQCKGLDNTACDTASSCSWVEGYERKDGRKVKSFCRTASKKSAQAKSATSKQAKTSSATASK